MLLQVPAFQLTLPIRTLPVSSYARLIVSFIGMGAADLESEASMKRSMYVVMEALDGGTLQAMVERQMACEADVYSKSDALRWGIQVGQRQGTG